MTEDREASWLGRRRRPSATAVLTSPTLYALVLIAVQISLRWPGIRDSWFFSDDLLFLSDIAVGQDDLAWYFRNHFGHVMPLSFVLVKQVSLAGALPWGSAATQILVLQALASVATWTMLRVLFGRRPLLLIPFGIYLFSVAGAPATTWWAVAVNQLPHQIALAGAITTHVLYLRTRRWYWPALSTVFLLIGFGTYTKTVLLPPVLLFLTVVYFCSGTAGQRVLRTVRRDWPAWLPYGVTTVGYLALYFAVPRQLATFGASPDLFATAVTHLLDTLIPTFVGGPVEWFRWSPPVSVVDPPVAVVVLAWLAVAVFVCGVGLQRSHALVALWLPGIYAAASFLIMVYSRTLLVESAGVSYLARQVQYLGDLAPVVALTVALMTMPLTGAAEPSRARERPLLRLGGSRRLRAAGLGVAVGAAFASAVVSQVRFAEPWRGDWDQRTFYETAEDELRRERPVLADTHVPATAVSLLLPQYSAITVALAPLQQYFTVVDQGLDLRLLRRDGTLAAADVDADNRMSDPPAACRKVSDEGRRIEIVPTIDYDLWTAVDLVATTTTDLELGFGPRQVTATVPPGHHTFLVETTKGYDAAWIRPEVGTSVCVEAIRVGPLGPGSDG